MQILTELPTHALFGDISPCSSPRGSPACSSRPTGKTLVLRSTRPVGPESFSLEAWSSTTPKDCPVCLEPLNDGELVQPMAACRHALHAECAQGWLCWSLQNGTDTQRVLCPECRGPAMIKRSELPEEEACIAVPALHLQGSES